MPNLQPQPRQVAACRGLPLDAASNTAIAGRTTTNYTVEVYAARPPSVFDQSIVDLGNEVDELARQLFSGGTLIAGGDAERTA